MNGKSIWNTFAVFIVIALVLSPGTVSAQAQLNPNNVRAAAQAAGLDSLKNVVVVDPPELVNFLNPGPQARQALNQLGKAAFWDRQVGSDGQACGSCHFAAFADTRTKNQLSPNLRNTDPEERVLFNPTASGNAGGANYNVTAGDFPFHQLADPLMENFKEREVTFDTDDVMSDQGVFAATFTGVPAPNALVDRATPLVDPDNFRVNNGAGTLVNVRRVEPRHAPSIINALLNVQNFWDGRASDAFNGVSVIGPLETTPFIWRNIGGALVQDPVGPLGIVAGSSLASLYEGPIVSFEEMSFAARKREDIGRKLFQGPTVFSSYPYTGNNSNLATQTRRPFQFQEVHNNDSLLSLTLFNQPVDMPAGADGLQISFPRSQIPFFKGPDGIFGTLDDPPAPGGGANVPMYQALVQIAFLPQYWNAPMSVNATGAPVIDPVLGVPQQVRTPQGYTLMESNLPLFFGLAFQMYAFTLFSSDTPFDRFMAGNNGAFDPPGFAGTPGTSQQAQDIMRGLLTFIKTDQAFQERDPIFSGINDGNCVFCHGNPGLSNAAVPLIAVEQEVEVELIHGRTVSELNKMGSEEDAFANIGVRPSREDLGRGGVAAAEDVARIGTVNSFSLSSIERFFQVQPAGLPPIAVLGPNTFRVLDDGAFKVPLLRNVELTAPYFHNGGELSLAQVVDFYIRSGDFGDVNTKDIEPNLAEDLILINDLDTPFLVKFLMSLTDDRVRFEKKPFDHPEIQVPNGHPGNNVALSGTGTDPLGKPTTGTTQVLTTGPQGNVVVAADSLLIVQATGADGTHQVNGANSPARAINNFLGISSTPVAGANNDQFDTQPVGTMVAAPASAQAAPALAQAAPAPLIPVDGVIVHDAGHVEVTWTGVPGATSYRIQRSLDKAFTRPVEFTVKAGITSYMDTTAKPDTIYRYRVFAMNAGGSSPPSNTVRILTPQQGR